jgi:hypothetical protein
MWSNLYPGGQLSTGVLTHMYEPIVFWQTLLLPQLAKFSVHSSISNKYIQITLTLLYRTLIEHLTHVNSHKALPFIMELTSSTISPRKPTTWICNILYCTILYCTTPHYTILYYTILYYNILYCTILTTLYYTILYYTILYYTILYYTVKAGQWYIIDTLFSFWEAYIMTAEILNFMYDCKGFIQFENEALTYLICKIHEKVSHLVAWSKNKWA